MKMAEGIVFINKICFQRLHLKFVFLNFKKVEIGNFTPQTHKAWFDRLVPQRSLE